MPRQKSSPQPIAGSPPDDSRAFAIAVGMLLLAVIAVYSNHFQNAFHFDDFHTVTDNPAIRKLSNIPRFFSDGRSFSVLRENQGWRPVVSTSLAVDYWLAGGYERLFWFHLSTFVAFLALLACVFAMFRAVLDRASAEPRNRWIALFATAAYGLHPVGAETVNYVIQRADVYVALGLTASVSLFAAWPAGRRFGIYLVPFLIGAMAKPTALVLPFLILSWLLLFEEGPVARKMLAFVPSLVAAVGMALVHKWMTPPTYTFGGADPYGYRITQPLVAWHTVRMFFWPTQLSADSDWTVYHSLAEPPVIWGFVFVLLVLASIALTVRARRRRPIAFGLLWFCITFLPTALAPLAEVTNDHRMLLPLIGITLSVAWGLALLTARLDQRLVAAAGLLVLLTLGFATHLRNEVWLSERTLWADVVAKSPRNGRGWMNYGLTFMRVAQYDEALRCFNKALEFTPSYSHLEINLGIAYGESETTSNEAERHFRRALELDSRSGRVQYYYARWLWKKRKRGLEAAATLRDGLLANPQNLDVRDLLLELYHAQHNWGALEALIEDTRRNAPDDTVVNAYATMLKNESGQDVSAAEKTVKEKPSPESWLELSMAYHQAGRFDDSIKASREALKLRPDYAEAWNNIAAANLGLKNWDAAIEAADRALGINPDFQLAKNNRAWAEQQKKAGAK